MTIKNHSIGRVRVVADPVQETLNLRVRELPTDKR